MLKILGWAGYDEGYKRTFDAFREDSGISISFHGAPNQDEMHKVAQNEEFDVACPTTDRLASWTASGLITPLDEARIGYERIDSAFHADAHTVIDGQRIGSPSIWGGAGIGHHTGKAQIDAATASLMDLFDPAYAGRLAIREDTAFVAAGRALEGTGKLPFAFADSYVAEDRMIANYDVIGAFLADHAHHVARFWFSEEEGVDAFKSGDCIIGYSWDSSLAQLERAGLPFSLCGSSGGCNLLPSEFRDEYKGRCRPGAGVDFLGQYSAGQRVLCQRPGCESLRHRGDGSDGCGYAGFHCTLIPDRGAVESLVAT